MNAMYAIAIVMLPHFVRLTRATVIGELAKDYVTSSRVAGAGRLRLMVSTVLPNCMPPLIVIATIDLAHAIALEATLSFLGVGVPVTEPSLGMLIYNGFEYLLSGQYWISFFPGIALALAIIAINLVGDHLRDVLNPRHAN
jgi:peptide/nickel transport system permease protein